MKITVKQINWSKLAKRFVSGDLTEAALLKMTKGQNEHPEWWDHACLCDLCLSYAD